MRKIKIICVGKLNEDYLKKLEEDYKKRISSFKIDIIETPAFDDDKQKEAQEILKKLKQLYKENLPSAVLLSENGVLHSSSKEFASWMIKKIEHDSKDLVFILGGASGHGEELLNLFQERLSLSNLTFPHKIARIILVEQIYRAECIKKGHPYHK